MSYILIPQIVSATTAMIWVGAIDEPVRIKPVSLEYNIVGDTTTKPESIKLPPSEWRTWKTRQSLERVWGNKPVDAIHYQRITVGLKEQLLPRTKYVFRLMVGDKKDMKDARLTKTTQGNFEDYSKTIEPEVTKPVEDETTHLTKATVTTLPEKIPHHSDPKGAFKVMLGSCFYQPNDPEGVVGEIFMNLPEDEQPEIKFLCGDQVYLDNPWKQLLNPIKGLFPKEKMRQDFFKKYLKTWTQVTRKQTFDAEGVSQRRVGGFNMLLRNGANYFCPDDHEFWNNAPNFGGAGVGLTLFQGQRRWWFREAGELFRIFQSLAPWMTFDVPPLSFCIADTRTNRFQHSYLRFWRNKEERFMEEDDLEAIGNWIENLTGPGVLVTGQVMLTEKSSFFTSLFERSLPDYPKQYKKLVDYIKNSRHSIVFLTGDVHFGRVSVCDLNKANKTKFVEVIASPMMIVSNMFGKPEVGKCETAFETFGTKVTQYDLAELQNHFATLAFKENEEGKIELTVKGWQIPTPGIENPPPLKNIPPIILD